MSDTERDQSTAATEPEVITTFFKAFDANWQCRGFQYAVGETYEHSGTVEACASGFHACEYPLDVLRYYPPAGSKFAAVEQSGQIAWHDGESKVASSRISIKAEIDLPFLIKAAIKWTFSRSKLEGETATGDGGPASATGDGGAAMASGRYGRAMGADGCALFLVERDDDWKIVAVWSGIVGRDGIKAGVWYTLDGGKPVEVQS